MTSAAAQGQAHLDAVAHALADGTRRGLLRLVRDGERAAGDLAAAFPEMSRPAVSQHLRVLRAAGLVTIRPHGDQRLYPARAEGLAEGWQVIGEMWAHPLGQAQGGARPNARGNPSLPRHPARP